MRKTRIKAQTIFIPAKSEEINGVQTLYAHGTTFKIFANSTTEKVLMSLDKEGVFFKMGVGSGFRFPEDLAFQEITFENPTDSIMELEYGVGFGDISDSSLAISGAVIVDDVATSMTDYADIAPTTLAVTTIPPSPNRKEIMIRNTGSVVMRYGDVDTVTTSRGMRLDVGETDILSANCAIGIIAESGTGAACLLSMDRA